MFSPLCCCSIFKWVHSFRFKYRYLLPSWCFFSCWCWNLSWWLCIKLKMVNAWWYECFSNYFLRSSGYYFVITIVLIAGGLSFKLCWWQTGAPSWYLFHNPFTFIAFFVYFISALAETTKLHSIFLKLNQNLFLVTTRNILDGLLSSPC